MPSLQLNRVLARTAATLTLALAMAAGTTGLLSGTEAHALPVAQGSFSFSGGGSYAYTAPQDHMDVSVDGANGGWRDLYLVAPAGPSHRGPTQEPPATRSTTRPSRACRSPAPSPSPRWSSAPRGS